MNLSNLIQRDPAPAPWAEGDNIPWHEPGFSARMLREHLSQEHDAAESYVALLAEAGYSDAATFPSLSGQPDASQADFFALLARKPA